MFVLLMTGYFKVLYYTEQNRSGFQVFKLKVHHFKFIRGRYAKSVLAIICILFFFSKTVRILVKWYFNLIFYELLGYLIMSFMSIPVIANDKNKPDCIFFLY